MKAVNKILQILVIVFGLAGVVLFFMNFVKIDMGDIKASLIGAELSFGSTIEASNGEKFNMAISADILFCFILTALNAIMGIFAFKSKKLRYAISGFGIGTAVYLLVIWLSGPFKFVDPRPFKYADIQGMTYSPFVMILALTMVAFAIAAVAYLLVDDYLEVKASNGEKLTIPKRVVRFFRDYKSEVHKIVWPGFKDVVKNTVIVLIMCLLVGALIWLVDFGLGKLLELIWGI